jgi:hypothetical protein
MGSEASKVAGAASTQKGEPQPQQQPSVVQSPSFSKALADGFEGIPLRPPMISRRQQSEQYPPDIAILSGNLPTAAKLGKPYFQQVATTMDKNQDHLAIGIKVQIDEYPELSAVLETRRNEPDIRFVKMLVQCRAFDAEVKTTVESLTTEIEKAGKLAEEIDPTIPKFADFGRQLAT